MKKRTTIAAFTAQEVADALAIKYPDRFKRMDDYHDLMIVSDQEVVITVTGIKK